MSAAEWANRALSSANRSSLTRIFVVFVFALKCDTLKKFASVLDWMYTPLLMPLKASSNIADKNRENGVGARTHPCFTPLVTGNETVSSVD